MAASDALTARLACVNANGDRLSVKNLQRKAKGRRSYISFTTLVLGLKPSLKKEFYESRYCLFF
jgi:hypothetical protein